MKHLKKTLALALSLLMMLTLLPTAAFAESNNAAVQEQFDLTVGETYYFYLTPNAENPDIPENSLHYVPFVYAGTVNAYTLTAANAETATVEEADASKYVHSLFIADNILQFGSIGDFFDLREHGMIYGREYKFGGVTYDLRAPSTGRKEIFNEENQRYEVLLHSNEWDAICDKNQELIHNYSDQFKDSWSYGQDMIRTANGEQNLSRGYMGIRGASYYPGDYWSTKQKWRYGYRPVLEIKDAGATGKDALRVLEVDLSGGLVDGNSTIRLVAGKGSSVTAPPIDGIRTPVGYVTEGFVWRGDNGQSYAPGAQIPAEVSSLTAVWKRETTGLMVGETYYFDLSGINYTQGGTLTPSYEMFTEQIPSGTLNYVPFTFVGEVDAYVLNEKAYTQPDVDDQAAQTRDANAEYGYTYPHSLFLADCALLKPSNYGVFLNQENFDTWKTLLYGQAYTSGGITYQMRAPSVGSPANNEWVQILHKDDRLIVGKGADKAYIGQECNLIGDYKTVYRNSRFWSENQWKLHTLGYLLEELTEYWRPVLELPQDVRAEDYREVTLDLNGGKIGSDARPVKLAVKNGSGFTAPKREGLTPPEGSAGTYLRWVSEDGHYYMPGRKPVPGTVRKLTADWATEERFTLEPGKTYYFDLSGEGIPGTVNEKLPDTTLHYVPFTYSGNIAAYWDTSGYYQYDKIITAEDAIQNQHSLFVADHNVTNSVSWDALNEKWLIFGRFYYGHSSESDNPKLYYTMRAPTGGNTAQDQYPYECESPRCNEWDVLIDKDPNNIKNWQDAFSYAQEIYNAKDSQGNQVLCYRTARGKDSQRRLFLCSPDESLYSIGYRPVLEANVFEADAMQTVTLDLNGGKLGNSGDDIAIVVSKEEAFRAPASAGLTRPAGDESGTYFFWVDDNGQRYRPGEAVPVGTKKLTAQWCVRELFDLEVGGTYYFDLSGAGIPGVVNEDLPDTTLHYVPFTHVGTVEAYYDNRYLYGDRRTDAHSLLIADYNITNDVSLNALSDALIFGSKTKFSGVYYALRAPSIGEARSWERDENSVYFDVITPENNEWDMILKKGDYIKNLEKYESFGQFYGYSRGLLKLYDSNYGLLAEIRTWFYCGSNPESNLGYRPVLQILNTDSPNNDTGTVTLKLNGGTLGTSNETELKIVTANGASFTAPAREGLTPPAGKENGAFVWLGDDGLYYRPGTTVPAEVSVLTAQWDTTTYTVTYRISDGSGSETTVQCATKAHDVPLTLKGKIYGRTGYKQVGWATSDGGEKVYELGGRYTENADVTLYPAWEKEHTHTYGGWSTDSTNHWHECTDPDCPNKSGSIKDTAEHTYGEDNKCSVCAYECLHDGGTATCIQKAVCEICGSEYGDFASHRFTAETVDAKYLKSAATCTDKAVYYKSCAVCGLTSKEEAEEATFESGEPDTSNHTGKPWWGGDGMQHWWFYPCCHTENGKQDHVYDSPTDTMCNVCGYVRTIRYTVTLNANGGTIADGKNVTEYIYGKGATLPTANDMTYTGHTFKGWYDNEGLTGSPVTAISSTEAGDKAYWAKWEVNQYTITVKPENGEADITITQDYGTPITAPTLTREGYQFNGWDKEFPTTMPAEDLTITAQWLDVAVPTGEIKIAENGWKSFLNTITFGLFFKDTQTVTVAATDNSGETVTIECLLSDKALTETELVGMTFTAYSKPFSINPDNEYVIYAKLTDTAGNTVYISSQGIVLDATAPVISGIENGKTYCAAQIVTVDEKYIDTVTVSGTEVSLDENDQFILSPASGEQTVVVTDKAGNETTVTVTVNDGHTGGTATCKDKAKCSVCGESYGELDANNHTDLQRFPAVAATKTAEGNIEYWYCSGCGKYYKDAKATQEITKVDTVTAKLPEGKPTSPKTGDTSNLTLWIALLFISGGAVTVTTVYGRKKKRSR